MSLLNETYTDEYGRYINNRYLLPYEEDDVMFAEGARFPPAGSIERLSKYKRCQAIFDGKQAEILERASSLLRDTPHAPQLAQLYIAVNLVDVLMTKPADLMVIDPPTFDSGFEDNTREQAALNSVIEENDLTQMIHEIVIGAGIRGDAWVKVRYGDRMTSEALEENDLPALPSVLEPIIEPVHPMYVFPELAKGSRKKFKAVNIAWVEWEDEYTEEKPYLYVEKHLPGYILYEKYRLINGSVVTPFDVPIHTFTLGEKVPTGREKDIEVTGARHPLVFHIPYKSLDLRWEGVGGIEKMEALLAAINDRLVQIDYILWKHSDPTAYGPELPTEEGGGVRFGGKYIPVAQNEVEPGYMEWNGQLEAAFKELDVLLSLVFQMAETPQWLFGTTVAGEEKGGTGTSHTDGAAIKARFMPILSKVKRIRTHVDKALRDALWSALELAKFANSGVSTFEPYAEFYPKINWRDGIPRNEKEEAEIYAIRTGDKATIDVKSAIKRLDGADDMQADAIITRIEADDQRITGMVDASIFNGPAGGNP